MKKFWLFTPLVCLLFIGYFLFGQLTQSDNLAPSEDWRGKPFPEFNQPDLLTRQSMEKKDLFTQPTLVNVWASWCNWCVKEFPILSQLKAQGVNIVGITYFDKSNEAKQALAHWGNPFNQIIDDASHNILAQTLNISRVPSNYLVDKQGVIRYQFNGYNPELMNKIMPLLAKLEAEK